MVAQTKKPNIVLIVSDDTGYGDLGAYGGGESRGIPTPSFDRIAEEGMTFFHAYAQPSCTPGRAAIITGRIPNRSGMTTVAFQGQGGGLPAAEWTLGSVLKKGGYATFYSGKYHLGEADDALPIAHGYDEMRYLGLYHLNAYTYADPTWFPDMEPEWRNMFQRITKGLLSGKAGEKATEDFKVNGQYVNTPEKGVVGIPFVDGYIEDASIDYLKRAYKAGTPFFAHFNFMKVHQPNLPHPDYIGKSMSKSKYADSLVELDSRVGRIMDTIQSLDKENNTLVVWTTDNGAWQDVYPDCGYTPFRGTKGTVREGGVRVPMMAWWPGKIKAGARNAEIIGGLDLMATFAALAGVKLPTVDRDGKPTIFDSYDMSPVLFGTGKSPRTVWYYFTEDELTPGAIRMGHFKLVWNLRGDGGVPTGGLSVDTNLGWKGAEKYVATMPQVFDLWQDPQERYDIAMSTIGDHSWIGPLIGPAMDELMKTYVEYPPRKIQSEAYSGPITLTQYERFEHMRDLLKKGGINIAMGTGN